MQDLIQERVGRSPTDEANCFICLSMRQVNVLCDALAHQFAAGKRAP